MNDPKERIVFSKKLAITLREAGFKILRVEVNKRYPQYDVYVFQNSAELQTAIDKYLEQN